MAEASRPAASHRAGTALPAGTGVLRLPIVALGLSLGFFFLITFAVCVGYDLLFPAQAMYQSWLRLLPGFTWLSWQSFGLGLVETFLYGWYVALIFAPLFNLFAARFR